MKTIRYLYLLVLLGFAGSLPAAYLEYVPQKLTQPDGAVLNCFASGDEYYHWLHDSKGYTIVMNRETGYFVYADRVGPDLVPTAWLPGIHDPAASGLTPSLNISTEKYRENFSTRFKDPNLKSARSYTNTGNYNNLVIFVRFSNQNEYSESLTKYSSAFNGTGSVSMTEYFKEVSKSQLNINTTFYPKAGGTTIVSYQDSHSRRYYQPYSASNAEGYRTDNEYVEREMTLLKNAAIYVNAEVTASGVDYDHDNDGKIDNICYIIQGQTDGWSDLLWPHRWVLYLYTVTIGGLQVYDFNFQLSETLGVSVLCHEMFHSLGAPDLYRYEDQSITPVGPWDLMAHNTTPPQHMSAYMKMKYGKWFTQIPTITTDGTYTLKPLSTDGYAAYKIPSPNSTSEFFVLEYRRAAGRFESSLVGSGLIIYRINSSLDGNAQGPPDEVYVYRQNGTSRSDGNINNATFSSSVGRPEFGDNTNPSDFLSNGSLGGIRITNIGSTGETISFTLGAGGALNPPRELTANLVGRDVTLSWQKPEAGSGTLSGFRVFRNNIAVTTISNPNTLTYTQTGLADGTWQYHVTARYTSPTGESGASNTVTVNVGTEAKPDLAISAPSVDPVNIEPGGSVTVSCTLENRGTAASGTSMLRVYLSLDEIFDSGDRQLASGTMDPLEAGMARDISGNDIVIPANTDNGKWYVLFLADADGTVTETIENNNQGSVGLTVGNPALNPPRNLVAQVAPATVMLSWMEPEPGGGTLAGYHVYRNGIAVATVENPAILEYNDTGLALGEYTFYLTAFYSEPAGESSRSNEVTVTLSNDAKPDLTVQNFMVTPAEVAPGGSIDISVDVLNIGAAAAGSSEVRLYLSKDMIQDAADLYLAYGTLDGINAGDGISVTGTDISLPDELESGVWYALLQVDAAQVVEETNEENNQIDTPVKVQGLSADLLITNLSLFPAIISANSNVRITFNVANNGLVSAAPIRTDFYFSDNEILDPSDTFLNYSATRFPLVGKNNFLMYSGFVMSPLVPPGQYYLIGMVDKSGEVAESDDSNNVFVRPITVSGTTGIGGELMGFELHIYPVPAKENLIVEFQAIPGERVIVTLTDVIGREVIHETRIADSGNRMEWDTRNWQPGQGFIKIQLKDRVLFGRYVIN